MVKRFSEVVQGKTFAISAELTLRSDSTVDEVRRQADELGGLVDGIQVTDNPYGWVQMSALSASAILLELGVDPVPVLTCRDRNRMALESDLMGLQALGVSSLMLMRGHRVPKNHAVQAKSVFDLTGRELIALAASLDRRFLHWHGRPCFSPRTPLAGRLPDLAFRGGRRFRADPVVFQHGNSSPLHGAIRRVGINPRLSGHGFPFASAIGNHRPLGEKEHE